MIIHIRDCTLQKGLSIKMIAHEQEYSCWVADELQWMKKYVRCTTDASHAFLKDINPCFI
jgi:hypothetical protein